ncbi:MAG: outer membrane lipoprotein-sorting protein [Fibrobacteria bacterium]|nr:outer membrane lipoprotein-sorting protein [Fibrobacteria bacterium]
MNQFLSLRILSVLFLSGAAAWADDATGWVRQSDQHARGRTSHTVVSIQVVRPDWKREMSVESWGQGSENALTLVTAPAKDKGSAFLKRGREVWSWLPKVERVVKLPPSMMSQSWMGTDMTNDDFVKESSVVDDYDHAFVGVDTLLGLPCHVVELVPKPGAPVVWGKIRMSIDDKDRMQLLVEFFDEDGLLVNTLRATEVGMLGGRRLPTRLEMLPHDKPGQKTGIHYLSAEFDKPIDDRVFSVRHLSELR